MPTPRERIVAVFATCVILLAGGWMASTPARGPVRWAESAAQAERTVHIEGVRSGHGDVVVLAFSDARSYRAYNPERAAAYVQVPAQAGDFTVPLALGSGRYAFAVWHDEDGDGAVGMRRGYPTEGYGTSGARSAYDAVPFERAVRSGDTRITMYYP